MADETLLTVVQISDLHFGKLDPRTASATLDSDAPDWYSRHALFRGGMS